MVPSDSGVEHPCLQLAGIDIREGRASQGETRVYQGKTQVSHCRGWGSDAGHRWDLMMG
jgi:hypothetical protein